MGKKLKIFLAGLILLSTILSFIVLLAPKTTQKIINTWFESGQEKVSPKQHRLPEEIKVIGPATSRSNSGQESRR